MSGLRGLRGDLEGAAVLARKMVAAWAFQYYTNATCVCGTRGSMRRAGSSNAATGLTNVHEWREEGEGGGYAALFGHRRMGSTLSIASLDMAVQPSRVAQVMHSMLIVQKLFHYAHHCQHHHQHHPLVSSTHKSAHTQSIKRKCTTAPTTDTPFSGHSLLRLFISNLLDPNLFNTHYSLFSSSSNRV